MGYRIVLPRGDCQGHPHTHPEEEKGSGAGGSPQVLGQGSQFLFSPSCQRQVGRRGGARPGCLHKASRSAAGRPGPRPGRTPRRAEQVGHLPSSSTFFPAGSLERERVETSLRMQDLAGDKAHAQAGAPRRRGCPGLHARTGAAENAAAWAGRRAPAGTRPWTIPGPGCRREPGRGAVLTKGSVRPRRRLPRRRRCPPLARWPRGRQCKSRLILADRNRRSRLAPRPPSWSGTHRSRQS